MSSTSTRRRVASNTAVQLGGRAIIAGAGALSIAVLTRYLGPFAYGKYTLALTYMQLFGVLADVGIYTTVVRDIARDEELTDDTVSAALTLRSALSLVVIVVAAGISHFLPYDHDVRVAILLAGIPLLFGAVTSSLVAIPAARLRMGRAVVGGVAGRLVALGLALLVAGLDLGFYPVMLAAGGGALASLIVTRRLTRSLGRIRLSFDFARWRTLLATGLPLGVALAINEVYFRADTFIISLTQSYDKVGNYTLAYRVLELTLIVGTVFLSSTFPIIADAVRNDRVRARRLIKLSVDALVILGVGLVAGGAVLARDVVSAAGGGHFQLAASPLRVLVFAGALAWVNGVFGFALISRDRQLSTLWLNVLALAFNVVLNIIFIPRYGIVAAAVITVASELVILIGSFFLMRRHLGFFPVPSTLLPALVAGGAMAAVLLLVPPVPVIVSMTLGIAVYAGVLWAISPTSRHVLLGIRP